jgi:hypothetical protein
MLSSALRFSLFTSFHMSSFSTIPPDILSLLEHQVTLFTVSESRCTTLAFRGRVTAFTTFPLPYDSHSFTPALLVECPTGPSIVPLRDHTLLFDDISILAADCEVAGTIPAPNSCLNLVAGTDTIIDALAFNLNPAFTAKDELIAVQLAPNPADPGLFVRLDTPVFPQYPTRHVSVIRIRAIAAARAINRA